MNGFFKDISAEEWFAPDFQAKLKAAEEREHRWLDLSKCPPDPSITKFFENLNKSSKPSNPPNIKQQDQQKPEHDTKSVATINSTTVKK